MKAQILTLRSICEKIPVLFSCGEQTIIKSLLLDMNDQFIPFYGKDKFYRDVLKIYPNYSPKILQPEYNNALRMVRMAYNFCHDYNEYILSKNTYFKTEWGVKFCFWESCEDYLKEREEEFKRLDGLILPIECEFWDHYLPPNFFGDFSSFQSIIDPPEFSQIPKELPAIESGFDYSPKNLIFY